MATEDILLVSRTLQIPLTIQLHSLLLKKLLYTCSYHHKTFNSISLHNYELVVSMGWSLNKLIRLMMSLNLQIG